MIDYEVNSQGVAVLTWNMQDRPVNVMNDDSLALFSELVERALADQAVKGLVIASGKRDFVTGADLASFLNDRRPAVIAAKTRATQQILRRMESGGKPVCAALQGSALGGGMEIALACHWRVATDKPSVRFGLPEVTLGLLPGAGGTQRLPRLIGVRAAIPYLLTGKTVAPTEALSAGMVSEVVPEERVLESATAWVAAQIGPVVQPWDRRGFVIPGGPLDPVTLYQVFALESARITARTRNNRPAEQHILSSVYEGCTMDIDTGLKSELRHFVACACSSESKNIIRTSFFGVTDAAKLKNRPAGVPALTIERLGVIGDLARVGIVIDSALKAKLPVRWLAAQQPLPPDWEGQVAQVTQASDLADCEVVVADAAYAGIPPSVRSVLRVWAGDVKDQVCLRADPDGGRLMEIVGDAVTSAVEVAHAMDLSRRLGKVPLVVQASGGTYVERVFGAYQDEVARLCKAGVQPVLINSAAYQAGMERAPLEAPAPDATPQRTFPESWRQAAADVARLKDRLLAVQAAEALRCLEEGVVTTPLAADIGALLGWGFPQHFGGPIGYVDTIGLQKFSELYETLAPDVEMDPRVLGRLREQAARAVTFHGD
jgi:3-hydroxyacyl-CoA dehydrogenase/enoyl-CoA hydratase/3-hydroxybutyryl-CoA epimerase